MDEVASWPGTTFMRWCCYFDAWGWPDEKEDLRFAFLILTVKGLFSKTLPDPRKLFPWQKGPELQDQTPEEMLLAGKIWAGRGRRR